MVVFLVVVVVDIAMEAVVVVVAVVVDVVFVPTVCKLSSCIMKIKSPPARERNRIKTRAKLARMVFLR